ncbi:Nn.00g067050.m01.CDS01 [Neocucurbitaria sp. VM-36]
MGWTLAELYRRFENVVVDKETLEVESDVLRRTSRILGCRLSALIPRDVIGVEVTISALYQQFDRPFNNFVETEADLVREAAKILKEPFSKLLMRAGIACTDTSQIPAPRTRSTTEYVSDSTNDIEIRHDTANTSSIPLDKSGTLKLAEQYASPTRPATTVDASAADESTIDDMTMRERVFSPTILQLQKVSTPGNGYTIDSQRSPTIGGTAAATTNQSVNFNLQSYNEFGDSIDPADFTAFERLDGTGFDRSLEELVPRSFNDDAIHPERDMLQGHYQLQLPTAPLDDGAVFVPAGDDQIMEAGSNTYLDIPQSSQSGVPPGPHAGLQLYGPFSEKQHSLQTEERDGVTIMPFAEGDIIRADVEPTSMNVGSNYSYDSLWDHPRPSQFDNEPQSLDFDNSRDGAAWLEQLGRSQWTNETSNTPIARSNAIATGRIRKPLLRSQAKQNYRNIRPKLADIAIQEGKACVACFLNHEGCKYDPESLVCRKCSKRGSGAFYIPCLASKIIDIEIYRTNTTLPQWKRFPFRGGKAGRLDMIQRWDPSSTREMRLSQGRGGSITLTLTRFEVPDGIPEVEQQIFGLPWGLLNEFFDDTKDTMKIYVDECMTEFAQQVLPNANQLTWCVFQLANRLAKRGDIHNDMRMLLIRTLELWTAARCFGTSWYQCAPDHDVDHGESPEEAPVVADHQLAVIVIAHTLDPLRAEIVRRLNNYYKKSGKMKRPEEVLVMFLTKYILLQHIEIVMQEQGSVARERKSQYRFTNISLVKDLEAAANTMLLHFHGICKGKFQNICASIMATWSDGEDKVCLKSIIDLMHKQKHTILAVTKSDGYDEEHYFTGQLLDTEWRHKSELDRPILMTPRKKAC